MIPATEPTGIPTFPPVERESHPDEDVSVEDPVSLELVGLLGLEEDPEEEVSFPSLELVAIGPTGIVVVAVGLPGSSWSQLNMIAA